MAIPNEAIKVEVPKWKYDDEDEGFVCDDAAFYLGRVYRFVENATAGSKPHVTLCGAGQRGMIAINSGTGGANGDLVMLRVEGQVGGEAGAAFNRGDELASDANGRLVAAGQGDYVVAVSRAAASQATHRVAVEVRLYQLN